MNPFAKTITNNKISHWLSIAMFCVLFIQMIVPVGYMPQMGTDDSFKMVICSASGMKTISIDSDFDPSKSPHKTENKQPCPFMALSDGSPFLGTVEPVLFNPSDGLNKYKIGQTNPRPMVPFIGNRGSRAPPIFLL
jgi:hypothetical protein